MVSSGEGWKSLRFQSVVYSLNLEGFFMKKFFVVLFNILSVRRIDASRVDTTDTVPNLTPKTR
jgi:hypothetical protein